MDTGAKKLKSSLGQIFDFNSCVPKIHAIKTRIIKNRVEHLFSNRLTKLELTRTYLDKIRHFSVK